MNIKLRSITNITGLALVLIAALVLSACGGDDAAAAEPVSTAIPEPTSTPEPTAIPAPKIPEVAVTTLEAVEPGSDNEKILAVFKQSVRAMNTRDYESFTLTCPPGNWENNQKTWDKLKIWWDSGGLFQTNLAEFTYDSFNARNITFQSYKDGTVQTKFAVYNYDDLLTEGWGWWWEEIDGEWYSGSVIYYGPTGRPNGG